MIHLRGWEESDAEVVLALYSDPAVMRFVPHPPFTEIGQARAAIARARANLETHGFCMWAACEGGIVVGACGFARVDGVLELAYHFLPATWGRGLATEAVRAALAKIDDPVVAYVHPDNVGSRRVAEKCGLRPDGADENGYLRYVR